MNQERDEQTDDVKLRLLNGAGGTRSWTSLKETRQCVLCEQTFTGYAVQVWWDRAGMPHLRCPTRGCLSTPAQWIHAGNPLISEEAWRDWVHLLDTLCDESAGPAPQSKTPIRKQMRRLVKRKRIGLGAEKAAAPMAHR